MPSHEDRTPERSYTAGGAACSRNVRTRRRRVDRPGVGGIAPDGLRPRLRRVRPPPRRSVRGRVRASPVGGPPLAGPLRGFRRRRARSRGADRPRTGHRHARAAVGTGGLAGVETLTRGVPRDRRHRAVPAGPAPRGRTDRRRRRTAPRGAGGGGGRGGDDAPRPPAPPPSPRPPRCPWGAAPRGTNAPPPPRWGWGGQVRGAPGGRKTPPTPSSRS